MGDTLEIDETKLQTVTPEGAPAVSRILTPDAARQILDDLQRADAPEAVRRATLQGMIDGNPPYDEKELDEKGLGNMVNVNFLEMRANLDARAASAHELFMEVATLIELDWDGPGRPQDTLNYAGIIAEEFTQMVMDWPGFQPAMDLVTRESDAYGLGVALFPDEWDWRPRAIKRGCLRFSPRARVEVNDNDLYVVRDFMTARELFAAIQDEEAASKAGWDVAAVRDLLVRVYLKGEEVGSPADPYQRSSWESLQQRIRNNDSDLLPKDYTDVPVSHLLVCEFVNGKQQEAVTHIIMPEQSGAAEQGAAFLFKKERRFENMRQALWLLPYNFADGYLRSVRGVASMMAPHVEMSNRFLGRAFDAGNLMSSLLCQPVSATDMSAMQLIRIGPVTYLPPTVKVIQNSFQPQVSSLIQLRDLSSSIMKNNTGTYRQHPEMLAEKQATKTAYQVASEVNKEARYEKADVAHRYNHLELLYREMFRRVFRKEYLTGSTPLPGCKEARDFWRRCTQRGVDETLLDHPEYFRVRATRAIGMGSLGVKLDISNQVLAARYLYDESGVVNAVRDWLAPRVGYHNIDRYKARLNRDTIPSNESSIAGLENNDFGEGASVPVGSDQSHAIHFTTHAPVITGLVQGFLQAQRQPGVQIDYAKVVGMLRAALPHMQAHLQYLAKDPTRKQFVANGGQVLTEGGKLLAMAEKLLAKQQQEQMLAQQAQQAEMEQMRQGMAAMDQDHQIELAKIQTSAQLKEAATARTQESLNRMRRLKAASGVQLQQEKLRANLALAAQKQIAELRIKAAAAQAELDLARLEHGLPADSDVMEDAVMGADAMEVPQVREPPAPEEEGGEVESTDPEVM